MLKKHNKLIMLLVLVTFMFTIVGSAGASTTSSVEFSDVEGGTVEAAAVYRLAGLGILEGYPDGTFGAEKTITRAEFAKIATYTAGLQDVAVGMTGVATGYPDVATDHWASGWINVASAQGFMKGYPDGSFGAEGQITQAEVITVLLRLLGYNDNLAGVWPSNYVSQAANMDVLDDVTFVSNQPATRGEVCIMTSETLNKFVVDYLASDNVFTEKLDSNKNGIYLLGQSFKSTVFVENAMAMGFRHSSTDELQLAWYLFDDTQEKLVDKDAPLATGGYEAYTGGFATAYGDVNFTTIDDSCVFAGGSILDVCEGFVEFDVNKDNEIISISFKDYGIIGPSLDPITPLDEVEVKNGKAVVDGKNYDFLNDANHVVLESVATPAATEAGVLAQYYAGYNAAGLTALLPTTVWANVAEYTTWRNSAPVTGALAGLPPAQAAAVIDGDDMQAAVVANTPFPVKGQKFADKDAYDSSDVYKLILNKNGKIAAVRAYSAPIAGIVERVAADKIYYFENAAAATQDVDGRVYTAAGDWEGYVNTTNFANEDIFVMNNSSEEITLADIQPLDAVTVQEGYRGYDYYLVVSTTKLPGTLQAYKENTDGKISEIKTLDKYWNISGGADAAVSVDGGKEFDAEKLTVDFFEDYDLWDQDVTAIMGAYGKIAALMFGDAAVATQNYGLVTEVGGALSYNGKAANNLTILKSDGEEYSYPVTKDTKLDGKGVNGTDYDNDKIGAGVETVLNAAVPAGKALVSVTIKSDGIVDRIQIMDAYNAFDATKDFDDDNQLAKINNKWYDAENVVVFNWDGADGSVLGWAEFKNLDSANDDLLGYKVNSSNQLQYVAVADPALSSDGLYAVRGTGAYRQSGDWYMPFIGMDAIQFDDGVLNTNAKRGDKGDIVRYTLDGNEIDDFAILYDYSAKAAKGYTDSSDYVDGYLKKISGNVLTYAYSTATNATTYSFRVDADTLYFDVEDNDDVVTGITASEFNSNYKNEKIVIWNAEDLDAEAGGDDLARVVAIVR